MPLVPFTPRVTSKPRGKPRRKDDKGIASAAAAWLNGRRCKQNGDPFAARLWLERAARLAPGDPRISIDLADISVTMGGEDNLAAAIARYEAVAKHYNTPPAWLGLAIAEWRRGAPGAAAAALGRLLGKYALADDALGNFAQRVAEAAALPGWCGVTPEGKITASVPKPSFMLDGATTRLTQDGNHFHLPPGRSLKILSAGRELLGSPLDLAFLRRVEGIADADAEKISGWAARPATPEKSPDLFLRDAAGAFYRVALAGTLPLDDSEPFLARHRFEIPLHRLAGLTPPFRLGNAADETIFGSPIDPEPALLAPAPRAGRIKSKPALPAIRPGLAVIMPVYRGFEMTRDCLASLSTGLPTGSRVIVIDDATPEPELANWLTVEAESGRFELLRFSQNRGFPAAVNAGIGAAPGCDILLLNSDTLVPPGAIATIWDAAYSKAEIGSVTPFSNAATILNYPNPQGQNPLPDLSETARLNLLAFQANGATVLEIPTGIGFCMLLRHDCLAATGTFRGEIFAQGYGEENDWCLRAARLGYIHVAATGAFVAHLAGGSFGGAGQALNRRNANRLNLIYPGYHKRIMNYIAADPLRPARRALDAARFAAQRNGGKAVVLISHHHGGGVARQVEVEMERLRARGLRPILIFPEAPADPVNTYFPWKAQLTDGALQDYPNLVFDLPAELPSLLALLEAERVDHIQMHHMLGHHPLLREIVTRLGVTQDIFVHDYASFCPRVNLLTRVAKDETLRYCGEPNLAGCIDCVARNGDETFEEIGVAATRARAAVEFAAARAVIAPSSDAARRIARHFPGTFPKVTPWEDDDTPVTLRAPRNGRRKIAVIGGIGPAKGFDLLIDCARDAVNRSLSLEFIVVGASSDDEKLLETGGIRVTGAYRESEARGLLDMIDADLAFIPSIWPETWCFTLSEAWAAGLYAIAFNLGAQGARIQTSGRGAVLPLGLPASKINDTLLAWQPDFRQVKMGAATRRNKTFVQG